MKAIPIQDLITIDDKINQHLEDLDPKNAEHRQLLIEALKIYVEKYISPAYHLASLDEEGDKYIDLEDVIGAEIEGFILSALFSSKRKNLLRPSDEELDHILDCFVDTVTPELRNNFWIAWSAEEAISCLMKLCKFLKEPLITTEKNQIKPSVLKQEIEQFQKILKFPMTAIKSWIENLIELEKEALAEWKNDSKNFITIES